jgi:PST family polysaccharide transporter
MTNPVPSSEERSPGDDSLAPRFARGGLYLTAGYGLGFALNFAINLAIARELGPDGFAPYALAFAWNELLVVLGAFSLNLALVQFREESQALYDTALAICAVIGLVGMLASLGIAGLAAQRGSVQAAWFIVALGAARILNLLVLVPWAKMDRALRYRALATVGLAAGTLPNLCALALAWSGVGALSLVLRDLLTALLGLGLIGFLSGYRFRFQVERAAAHRLMRFSRRIFLAQGLDALLDRVDRVVLAAAFAPRVVGLYHQARYLALAGSEAARPLFQLSFNLYARTQQDPEQQARSHRFVNYCLARGAAAVATVWLVFPEESVRLLLGEAWLPASSMLRWLAIYAILVPISMSANQLLLARGEAIKTVHVRLAQALVFLPGVAAAAALGSVPGLVVALTAAALVGIGIANRYNAQLLETRLRSALVPPLLACVATWLGCELLIRSGITSALAWPIRPFLAPLGFALVLLLIERRRLLRQAGFLLRALQEGGREGFEVRSD